MAASISQKAIVLDSFALRQFGDETYTGTKINFPVAEFEDRVNEYLEKGSPLHDGYAPFCKHLFIPNFAGVEGAIVPITPENEHKLKSGYEARTPKELAVLCRWFPKGSVAPPLARYLDIILYSREQIRLETAAMNKEKEDCDAPWGVVSIKAQDIDHEILMNPITMMRNALGREEGGSGVPLDAELYRQSVAFWSEHALIK